jgi:hypothetical protein
MKNRFNNGKFIFNKETPVVIFSLILVLIGPFFLIALENWCSLDVLPEEIFKLAIILLLAYFVVDDFKFLFLAFFVGLFFALTENILYLSNFVLLGSDEHFWERFFLTSFLHVGTTIITAGIVIEKKYFFPIALVINMALHYIFNTFLVLK